MAVRYRPYSPGASRHHPARWRLPRGFFAGRPWPNNCDGSRPKRRSGPTERRAPASAEAHSAVRRVLQRNVSEDLVGWCAGRLLQTYEKHEREVGEPEHELWLLVLGDVREEHFTGEVR